MNDGKRFSLWANCSTEWLNLTLQGMMEEIGWRRNRIARGDLLPHQFDELAREVNNKAYDCKLIAQELKRRAARGEAICNLARDWSD